MRNFHRIQNKVYLNDPMVEFVPNLFILDGIPTIFTSFLICWYEMFHLLLVLVVGSVCFCLSATYVSNGTRNGHHCISN